MSEPVLGFAEPGIREHVQREHDVRLARRDVADLDALLAVTHVEEERRKVIARSHQARRRLVRVLARRLLPPGPETDAFLLRLEDGLREARINHERLDAIAAALDPKETTT